VNFTTNNLTIGYADHAVQRGLNISLRESEMVVLLGPNGCGKTTLLRTMAGLLPSIEGSVSPVLTEKNMALVLTERLSLDNTSIHDVVAMGRYPYTSFLGTLTDEDEHIIEWAIGEVGLDGEMAKREFNALSDGEKQRVLIAKALAQQTDLILLDEPTAHLDLPNRIRVFKLLHKLAEEGKTILISTHELDLALAFANRALLMSKNGTQMIDHPREARTNSAIRAAFQDAYQMDIFDYDNSSFGI